MMIHTTGSNKKHAANNFSFVLSFLRKLYDTFDLGFTPSTADNAFRAKYQHAVYKYLRSSSVDVVIKDMMQTGAQATHYPFDQDRLKQPAVVLATAASIEAFATATSGFYGNIPWVDFMRVVFGEVLGSWSANPKRSRNLMLLFFEAITLQIHSDTWTRLPPATRTSAADHVDVRVTFWAAAFMNSLLCPGFENNYNKKDNKWHTAALKRYVADTDINAERRILIEKTLAAVERCETYLPQWRGFVSDLQGLVSRVHEPANIEIMTDIIHDFSAPDTVEEADGAKTIASITNICGIQFWLGIYEIALFEGQQEDDAAPVVYEEEKVALPTGDRNRVDEMLNMLDIQERQLGGASLVEDAHHVMLMTEEYSNDDDIQFSAVLVDFLNDNEVALKEMQELRAQQEAEAHAKKLHEEVSQTLDSLCQSVARDAVIRERVETSQAIERVLSVADDDMAAKLITALLKKISTTRAHALVKETLFSNDDAKVITALIPSLEFIASPPPECTICFDPLDYTHKDTVQITCCDGNLFSCADCARKAVAEHPHPFTFERAVVGVIAKVQGGGGGEKKK